MKKIQIEFHINDEAAKDVAKAAKGFFKSIVGLVNSHGVKVNTLPSDEKKEENSVNEEKDKK
jgi:hypothetical protein